MHGVEIAADFVRHGVRNAEEGVGKGHACHGGGVVHFFPRFKIGVFHRAFQILEDDFDGLQRETVGVVVGEGGNVGLNRVGEDVHAGIGDDVRRHGHDEGGINDGDRRGERVVGKWVFAVVLFVGNNGKRRDFRASAGGGRDTDVFGFFAKFGEFEGAFADVHEFLHEVAEVDMRLFVEEPHDFRRIHDRAAAQGDDGVRCKGFHDFRATGDGGDVRIGLDVGEDGVGNVVAAQVQLFDDALQEAVFDHGFVGDDHGFGHVFHCLQVLHRIALEVDFGGDFEPLHIVSPAADFFDVQQVDGADVVVDRVAPVGTAAEGERRQEGVVHVADAAEGGG